MPTPLIRALLLISVLLGCQACLRAQGIKVDSSHDTTRTISKDIYGVRFGEPKYLGHCLARYCVEIHNPFAVPILFVKPENDGGYRLAKVWGPLQGNVRILPGKSILVGLTDLRPGKVCDVDSFLQGHPGYTTPLFLHMDSIPDFQSVKESVGLIMGKMTMRVNLQLRSANVMSYGGKGNFGQRGADERIADSVEVTTRPFSPVLYPGFEFNKDVPPSKGMPRRTVIYGLIRVWNRSSRPITIDSLATGDPSTRVTGLPEWMRGEATLWEPVTLPPGKAVAVEYISDIPEDRFGGDIAKLKAADYSCPISVYIDGVRSAPLAGRIIINGADL